MKIKILVTLLLVVFVVACNKNNYNTTPTLRLKSVGNKVVPFGGFLRVEFEVTDKEGDISDTLYFKKIRLNKLTTTTVRDSLAFQIPHKFFLYSLLHYTYHNDRKERRPSLFLN